MTEEKLSKFIQNQKTELKQQIIDIQKELTSVNTDWLMQGVYYDWLIQTQHNQQNQNYDNDIGFIIFVYSLLLNTPEYNTDETDPKVIMELIDRIKEIFNNARIVGNCPDLLNMSNDMIIKQRIYDHYKMYKLIRDIYGIMAYPYQLIEYLDFLIANFDDCVIKEKGYSLKILKIMHNKIILIKKKLYLDQSLTSKQRLNLSLTLYTDLSALDTSSVFTTPVNEDSKKLGIKDYTEFGKWYNAFIREFSCKFGDNNNSYIFPSDHQTILIQKPFIIKPDNPIFHINPFFAEVGLPMHLKNFDR